MVDQEPHDVDPYEKFAPYQAGARKLIEGLVATFTDPTVRRCLVWAEGYQMGSSINLQMQRIVQVGAAMDSVGREEYYGGFVEAVINRFTFTAEDQKERAKSAFELFLTEVATRVSDSHRSS